jgi:hypothetical protein
LLNTYIACRTGSIIHNQRLPKQLGQLEPNRARRKVSATTRL